VRLAASVLILTTGMSAVSLSPLAGRSVVSSGHGAPAGMHAVTAAVADSLDDGPHIYWKDTSSPIVFYLCGGSVIGKQYEASDTLRFTGMCSDSAWEYVVPVRPPEVEPHLYEGASKIFAISDIHGEYDALVEILEASGIIDENLHWSWGDGHLVVDGDVFDRGSKVTECLWLLYRLELEARRVDGRVHVLLGNHETMVMHRDLRYVNKKYLDGIARMTSINYTDLYGPDMEIGRWLRTKHTAIKVNDILFVHGGIPPLFASTGVSLAEINQLARETLDSRSYEIAFDAKLTKYYGDSDEGPFWYRGYHFPRAGRYPQATVEQVDSILRAYGARAIVVGHTGVDVVTSMYGGKVFGIDVPLEELGSFQGLLWEDDRFFRVDGSGARELLER
jgi:hypothetical protein